MDALLEERLALPPGPVSIDDLLGAPSDALILGREKVIPRPKKEAPGTRQCVGCGVVKSTGPDAWPQYKRQPSGRVCKLCKRASRNERERKLNKAIQAVAAETVAGGQSVIAERRYANMEKALARATTRRKADTEIRESIVANVLKQGVEKLAKVGAPVMALVFQYAQDPKSIHHEWALKLITDRLLPRRIFEELGAKAAGIEGGLDDRRPVFQVNIVQSEQPRLVRTTIDVPALPSADDIVDVTPGG